MNKWEIASLGGQVRHKKGFAFKSTWFQDHGIPIVKVSDFTRDSVDLSNLVFVSDAIAVEKRDYKLRSNDVVIQTVGSWPNNPASVVGKAIRIPRDLNGALLNQNAVILRPKQDFCESFLYYLLASESFKGYIIARAQGAANQASITLESIFQFQFYRPSLPIQRKIAAILSAYDDLIENNNRRIALLEKMAEEIYREWFVRLRFPGHEGVKKHKGIPEGWDVRTLESICTLKYGKMPDKRKIVDHGYPIFSGYRMTGFYSEVMLKTPTVVVVARGVGGTGNVVFSPSNCWLTNLSIAVQPIERDSKHYLYYFLKNQNLRSLDTGSAQSQITSGILGKVSIFCPPAQLQNQFDETVIPMLNCVKSLQESTKNLAHTRDRLLSRLISGKLSVEDLDIQFPPSMAEPSPSKKANSD